MHTGNALRGYQVGRMARERGAWVIYGGIHATLFPEEALERWQCEEIQLMAPTVRTLQEIDEHPDSASVLAAADERVVRPVTPEVRRDGGKVVIVLPDDPDFELDVQRIVPGGGA